MCLCVRVCVCVCIYMCVCDARIRRAPMSWLRTRSAYRIIVDHSGKEYFHHIQCNTIQHTNSMKCMFTLSVCVKKNSFNDVIGKCYGVRQT